MFSFDTCNDIKRIKKTGQEGVSGSVYFVNTFFTVRRFYHYKNDVLPKRPIILSKWTTGGISFQNKKEAGFANLIKPGVATKLSRRVLLKSMSKLSSRYIITGVIQLIPPVLSSETLLHILLSSEFSDFRPSTTAVVTISAPRAKISSLFSAIITENCQEGIYRYFQRVSNFFNI